MAARFSRSARLAEHDALDGAAVGVVASGEQPTFVHPRRIGWIGTTALAMGGSNQSLFLIGALVLSQGTAAIPLLVAGLLLSWAAAPGWVELVLMWPERVGGIAASCAEAFRPYSPVLANLTGVSYWWGWVPTCGLTAILSGSAIHQWYLPGVPVPLLATGVVVLFTCVNFMGVHWATRVAVPVALAAGLLALLSVAVPVLAGSVDWHRAASFHLSSPFHGFFGGLTSAMAGLYLIGFAAPAFEAAACHVGETRNPERNVKRAVFAAGGVASIFFVAIPVIWLGVLGAKPLEGNLAQTLGPTFAPLFGAGAKGVVIWFVILNMFLGTLQPLAGASRTLMQLSEDGLLPRALAKRSRRDVPWVATIVTAAVSIAFLRAGDPTWLIAAANLCYLIGIGMPSIAVWLLRRNEPDRPRPYRAPRGTILLGVGAAGVWLLTTVLGFEQFGLPTVIVSIGLAYAGSVLYAWRVIGDRRRAGLPAVRSSLHLKLTGAMIAVMVFDGVGYLLAVNNVHADPAVKAALEDIFVVVALLTITVGLVLPGMIGQAVSDVADGAQRLASGTLSELTRAMQALARGDLASAHARKDVVELVPHSRDELGTMAETFNVMQHQVRDAAVALDGARDGLAASKAELARYAREQAALAQAEQRAREATERANAAKTEFLSHVSHELRTPLNAILGFGQLLEVAKLELEQRECVDEILIGGRHLLQVVDELLAISRIETGTMTLSLEPVDVTSQLSEVLALCATLVAERSLQVSRVVEPERLWVMADEQRLRQVLLNLLSNAVKYNRPGGSITLAAHRESDERIVVEVSDTGWGISEAQRERLFGAFERLDAAKRGVEGTGLGLALAKDLVEAMGGRISVRSELGSGSTFSVSLQAAEESQIVAAQPLVATRGTATIPSDGSRGLVLCVEDNPANLRLIERLIVEHAQASFVSVSEGRLAVETARRHQPDLILLDVHLPDIGGADVLTQLRGDPATSHIPVVVLSADATQGQIKRLLARGAEQYLTKPIEVPELLEAVQARLPSRRSSL
jgi:signal transduction histidine kinase/ActR/RegA family two-component response regulator